MSPELASDSRKEIVEGLIAIIDREGGKWMRSTIGVPPAGLPCPEPDPWILCPPHFDAPGPLVAELERNIRITDGIFKFVTVKLDETAKAEEA